MPASLSRRMLLTSAGGVAMGIAPGARALRAASLGKLDLIAGSRIIEVNRKPAQVFALRQPNGDSGLVLAPDQRFAVSAIQRQDLS